MPVQAPTTNGLEHRRAEVARHYLQGEPQHAIADALGICLGQVGRDLSALQAQWIQSASSSFAERRAQELAKIDHMEREAWQAWERSKRERGVTSSAKTTGDTTRVTAAVRKEDRVGDTEFLKVVQWCISMRCELLGV